MILNNRIYDVEEALDPGPELEYIKDIQRFVEYVIDSDYWRDHSAIRIVDLIISRDEETGALKHRRAYGVIYIWRPLTQMEILHELAHFLAWIPGDTHRVHHNRAFIAAYVGLVYEFLGQRLGDGLRNDIIQQKVYGYKALIDKDRES